MTNLVAVRVQKLPLFPCSVIGNILDFDSSVFGSSSDEGANTGMWDSGSPRALGTRLGTFDSCHPDHFGDLRISENSTV